MMGLVTLRLKRRSHSLRSPGRVFFEVGMLHLQNTSPISLSIACQLDVSAGPCAVISICLAVPVPEKFLLLPDLVMQGDDGDDRENQKD